MARIATPSGTTINAGPGRTIMTSPINTTLNPIAPIRNRRNAGRASSPKRVIHFCNQRFTLNRALSRNKFCHFLFEMRRHMSGDEGVFAFISHLKDMADAMKFCNEI